MIEKINREDKTVITAVQDFYNKHINEKITIEKQYEVNPYIEIYVYSEDDNIRGLIEISNIIDRYEINYIYVDQQYRRKKIASKLIETIIDNGKKEKIENITLEVRKDNLNAISLYEKYKFMKKAIRKNYYNGIDGILMEKEMRL